MRPSIYPPRSSSPVSVASRSSQSERKKPKRIAYLRTPPCTRRQTASHRRRILRKTSSFRSKSSRSEDQSKFLKGFPRRVICMYKQYGFWVIILEKCKFFSSKQLLDGWMDGWMDRMDPRHQFQSTARHPSVSSRLVRRFA